MNIIITGHKGLIGSYLKERLEQEGHKIILGIDKKEGKDISDMKDMLLNEKADMVIHAAAHCKINEAIKHPELAYKNDVEGTFSVLEFCRKNEIPRILFFSSSRVLSREKNPYTASKIYGEELCKGYKDCYGIDYLIIRPSTVYGPFWDRTERLMHKFIVNALENKDLEIYGNPETKTLDFTYVDDFVDATILAIEGEWNLEYDVSGGEEFRVYDLARMIIDKTNSKSEIRVLKEETAQPQKIKIDISKIMGRGYSPKIGLAEGVNKCIEFYKRSLCNQ